MFNIKNKVVNFLKWILKECKDKKTIIILLFVIIIMYFPVWGGFVLGGWLKWQWCYAVASAYALFWAGPFTPFFPVCIAITLGIKKLITKKHK